MPKNKFGSFDKYNNLVLSSKIEICENNLTTICDIFDSYNAAALAAVESTTQLIWVLGMTENNLADGIKLLEQDPKFFNLCKKPESLTIALKPN